MSDGLPGAGFRQGSRALRRLLWGVTVVLAVLVGGEIGIRWGGLVDFPLYDTSPSLGYVVRPNQSGSFMNRHRWIFNDKGMATDTWNPDARPNILLIGNSVVMGGNPYDQAEKLGPLIARDLGGTFSVWPIATGGWTNINETNYLSEHPEVTSKANFFVWEYMHGGLGKLSPWRGEYVFPTRRPIWATWYVFRRYLLPKLVSTGMSELPPDETVRSDELLRFKAALTDLAAATKRSPAGIVFLYPDETQLEAARSGEKWLPDKDLLENICEERGLLLLDLAAEPDWQVTLYRDGTHPTVAGNAVLARILARHVKAALGVQ